MPGARLRGFDRVHCENADGGGARPMVGMQLLQGGDVQLSILSGSRFRAVDSSRSGEFKRTACSRGVKVHELRREELGFFARFCSPAIRGGAGPRKTGNGGHGRHRGISTTDHRGARTASGRAMEARQTAGGGQDLAEELEAERVANAQLEERVRAIREKQETTVSALEKTVEDLSAEIASLKEALADRDGGLQRIRRVNAELRRSNAALREANALKGLPTPIS